MLGKNTILKAIHNLVVKRIKYFLWCECWVKIQFWKLFTTEHEIIKEMKKVWMLGKNTILKAIHNTSLVIVNRMNGVNAG